MKSDRHDAALLFLPRCVWHRFREPDGFFVSQCRSRGLRPRIALNCRLWRANRSCHDLRGLSAACLQGVRGSP